MSVPGMAGSMNHGSAEVPAEGGGRLAAFDRTHHMVYPNAVQVELIDGGGFATVTDLAEFRAGKQAAAGQAPEVVNGPSADAIPLKEGRIDLRHQGIQAARDEVAAALAQAGTDGSEQPHAEIDKYLKEAA